MNEFKPGDVVVHPKRGRGIVQLGSEGEVLWLEFERHDGVFRVSSLAPNLRRLVVIDPDAREDVERLRGLFDAAVIHQNDDPYPLDVTPGMRGNAMQAALREFANPKPSKPAEPTGLGAVVEDAAGERWVRATNYTTVRHWRGCDGHRQGRRRYADIDAVRVLSEGVR